MEKYMGPQHQFEAADYGKYKTVGSIGYLIFFVPLIADAKSPYCRFCANQGLLVWILCIAISIVFGILGVIPLLGWLFNLVRTLVGLAIALVAIYLMYSAMNNKVYELPFIGGTKIIH